MSAVSTGLKRLLWLRESGPVRKGWRSDGRRTNDKPHANTVTRPIYLVDISSGPNQNEVVLYVYTKVDTITRIPIRLLLLYPKQSVCLWLGAFWTTNYPSMEPISDSFSLEQDRTRWRFRSTSATLVSPSLAGSPADQHFGITANDYGYVTLSFGSFNSPNTDFIVVGPDGSDVEDGVGSQFMLNTDQAVKLTAMSAAFRDLRTRGFLILSGVAGSAVGTIRKSASRPRPRRQSTRRCHQVNTDPASDHR